MMFFGMQHCFNLPRQNMEDNLKYFENGRGPQFLKMEDDHKVLNINKN